MADGHPLVPESTILRCHRNVIASYRYFAEATKGGRFVECPGLVRIDAGAADNMGNAAFVTAPREDPGKVLKQGLEFFADGGRPWVIVAYPEVAEELRPAAIEAGLRDEGSFPGVVLDPLSETTPVSPVGYRVVPARTMNELERFERTGSAAFEFAFSEPDVRWLTRPELTLLLGSIGDEPVALAALIVSERIAVLAYIGTLAAHRRRGFAEALVWRAVVEARRKGRDIAYLSATPIGRLVYDRTGFRQILDYHLWTEPEALVPPGIHLR